MKFNFKHSKLSKSISFIVFGSVLLGSVQTYAQIEEIIVTANKREQSTQDLASSINVVTAKTLEDYSILTFEEIQEYTSGLDLNRINARNQTFSIRGITQDPESGTNPSVDPYLNDVLIFGDIAFNNLYDTERVEVLKGPQGALQGRTSPAGSIQIYSKKADFESVNGYVQTVFADNDASNLQAAINIPLSDSLAIRVAGLHDNNDQEEVLNVITGNIQDFTSNSYRTSLSWEPRDDLRFYLTYQNQDQEILDSFPLEGSRDSGSIQLGPQVISTPCANLQAIQGNANGLDSCTTIDRDDNLALASFDDVSTSNVDVVTANVSFDVPGHTVDYIFGYYDSVKVNRQQNDNTFNLPLQNLVFQASFGIVNDTDYRTDQGTTTRRDFTSQEIRIQSNDNDRWNYLFGFYISDNNSSTEFESFSTDARFNPIPDPTTNPPIPIDPDPSLVIPEVFPDGLPGYMLSLSGNPIIEGVNFSTGGTIPVNNDVTALFTAHNFQINDQFEIDAAIRWQRNEAFRLNDIFLTGFNQQDNISVQGLSVTTDNPILNNPPAPLATAIGQIIDGTVGAITGDIIDRTLDGLAASFPIVGVSDEDSVTDVNAVTGSLSLKYYWSDNLTFFAAYNRGYRADGISIVPGFALGSDNLVHDEEFSNNFEFGFKSTFLDGSAQLNASVFTQNFDGYLGFQRDVLVNAPQGSPTNPIRRITGGIIFNGDATATGIDLDARLLITPNWSYGINLTYVNFEWDSGALRPCDIELDANGDAVNPDIIVNRCNVEGQRIAGAPDLTFNIFSEYFRQIGSVEGFIRGNARYVGSLSSTDPTFVTDGSAPPETEPYGLFNLFLGIRAPEGDWELAVWSKNLFNSQAETDVTSFGVGNFDPNADFREVRQVLQRTFGVTARYNF